ncbi:MAG: family 43 glycosylhydrolase [Bacteroidaceae bacterium]|nr:family 43 glycosylhydrolase [Bacteroidaceae bacterium]
MKHSLKKSLLPWHGLVLGLLLFSAWGSETSAQVFKNPMIDENAADPTVMKAKNGYYYLYSTGARIFRSKDMLQWNEVGNCFAEDGAPSFVPGVRRIWAPDINYIKGQYVLYFALSKWGGEDSCGVGVATSKNPEGPFTCINRTGKLFRSFEIGVRNSIDPFYIKDKGKNWLIWGSFSGIYAIELTKDGLAVKPGSKPIPLAGKAYEGSYVYKRKGYYYFFGSIGTCCEGAKSTYTTVVARSKNLLGPYVNKKGETLLTNHHEVLIHGNSRWAGTGHNGELIKDKKGNTWIPYHAYHRDDPKKGRIVLLDKVQWDQDGWPFVAGQEPADAYTAPKF